MVAEVLQAFCQSDTHCQKNVVVEAWAAAKTFKRLKKAYFFVFLSNAETKYASILYENSQPTQWNAATAKILDSLFFLQALIPYLW